MKEVKLNYFPTIPDFVQKIQTSRPLAQLELYSTQSDCCLQPRASIRLSQRHIDYAANRKENS